MFILGVTGGSGSGKTLLGEWLRANCGALLLDADRIYHEMLRTDADLQAALAAEFGPEAVKNGEVDRPALARIVFGDAEKLRRLDEITHPRIVGRIREELARADAPMAVIDAFGLVQSGLDRLCDETVAVCCDRDTRIARVMQRDGVGAAEAAARIDAQPDDAFYRAACGRVLNNSGDKAQFSADAERMIKKICRKGRNGYVKRKNQRNESSR